jgi:hypothetical protein
MLQLPVSENRCDSLTLVYWSGQMSYTFPPQNITIEALKYKTLTQEEYLEELSVQVWKFAATKSREVLLKFG